MALFSQNEIIVELPIIRHARLMIIAHARWRPH
jgi:hypothetical protein